MLRELKEALERLKITNRDKVLAKRYGYLPYMIARYREMLGNPVPLLKAFEEEPPNTIFCNPIKGSCNELVKRLEKRGFKFEKVPWSPYCFEASKEPYSLSSTPEHLAGWFYILDKASCLPPIVLDPKGRDRVADMAAAPGGKTVQLSVMMGLRGYLVSIERNPKRAKALISNIERMGLLNVKVIIDDASNASKYGPFEKVLLDAPCTGEGVIGRDRSRKRSKGIDDLLLMHKVQVFLLNRAIDSLKVGGEVVYSTCSIAPEEDEAVIASILEKRGDVEVTDSGEAGSPGISEYLNLKFPFASKCRRLWPHVHGSEGFFVCKLKRVG
ncbi:integrase [Ignicoccus islandicus DSM 13165]|uniref:Integrase n=1 Tax=Ignicoccus islandicus DSM 13165 TaxID=940295 RepID=A0A0U2U725_9CREN|nr:RsmB/NOP family class I SAM-dependent RNA methyltransferase [Ignicoccus islandicus]ALU11940.1 integrase [Ignicoccus islandicus DSM 13165]